MSDLNLEMSYWPLNLVDLGEVVEPLADWLGTMIPQAREAAMDRFGCRGIVINLHCSLRDIGGVDRNCIVATGAAAWLGQVLWQYWEYTQDESYLREKLYPFLKEVGLFYEDNFVDIGEGQLAPCPSCSPEMLIKGRTSARFYGD